MTFVLAVAIQPLAQATSYYPLGPRTDSSFTDGYPGDDLYSVCVHTDWGYSDDICAGLGMQAKYDTYQAGLGHYYYNSVLWAFAADYGFSNHYTKWITSRYDTAMICPASTLTWQSSGWQDYSGYTLNSWGEEFSNTWTPGPGSNNFMSISDAIEVNGYSTVIYTSNGVNFYSLYATVFQQNAGAMVANAPQYYHTWSTVDPTTYP